MNFLLGIIVGHVLTSSPSIPQKCHTETMTVVQVKNCDWFGECSVWAQSQTQARVYSSYGKPPNKGASYPWQVCE